MHDIYLLPLCQCDINWFTRFFQAIIYGRVIPENSSKFSKLSVCYIYNNYFIILLLLHNSSLKLVVLLMLKEHWKAHNTFIHSFIIFREKHVELMQKNVSGLHIVGAFETMFNDTDQAGEYKSTALYSWCVTVGD